MSVQRQYELLGLPRSTYYYQPESAALSLMFFKTSIHAVVMVDWRLQITFSSGCFPGSVYVSDGKTKTAKDVRDGVLKSMAQLIRQHNELEVVRGGMSVGPERIPEKLDLTKGFWRDSGDYHKPLRWLFHIVPATSGPRAVWPSQPSFTSLGVISAISAGKRKAVLTFRLFPLFKISDVRYEPHLGWEWLLWIVLKRPLSPSLGNSAPVQKLNFSSGEVFIRGQQHEIIAGGLVGLCDPSESVTFEGFSGPITYGAISASLRELLKQLGQLADQKVQIISTLAMEVPNT